jgi:hypothetical protein
MPLAGLAAELINRSVKMPQWMKKTTGAQPKGHQWSTGRGDEWPARYVADGQQETWRCGRPTGRGAQCPGLLATVSISEGYREHRNIRTGKLTRIFERDSFVRLDGFKLILKDGRKFFRKSPDGGVHFLEPCEAHPTVIACPGCNAINFMLSIRGVVSSAN